MPFCDGEAEQSEDEAVSSDKDMDDDGAAMSVEEVGSLTSGPRAFCCRCSWEYAEQQAVGHVCCRTNLYSS